MNLIEWIIVVKVKKQEKGQKHMVIERQLKEKLTEKENEE